MLKDDLKTLIGTSYAFSVKASGFHWNIEGPDFPQYHKFLGKLYKDVYNSIDKVAEYIRTLDAYAPGSLTRFLELSVISDQLQIPRAELMFQELLEDNERMISILNTTFSSAESENKQGVANFIAERLDSHEKFGWMMRSILNKARS